MDLYSNAHILILIYAIWEKAAVSSKRRIYNFPVHKDLYTNKWIIHIKDGGKVVRKLAHKHKFIYHGQLGSLKDFFQLEHEDVPVRSDKLSPVINNLLAINPEVIWLQQQKINKRVTRGFISDPLFNKQWYLKYNGQVRDDCGYSNKSVAKDMNILPVWKSNVTGKGVVVCIIDDGLEYTHPDLKRNFDPLASYDYNDNDFDPSPRYTNDNINKHGTRCAGEVASEINNGICGVGVAYDCKLGGIRMLDGDVTDSLESASLSFKQEYIDIYSVSWGPDDNGRTVDGPGPLTKRAIKQGILYGRRGLGSIFVWATGNGGKNKDYCSCDGYLNSPYTISIGAADKCGFKPWYAEECPSTLAVTFSGKAPRGKGLGISTTDLRGKCTTKHTGSSAAAPLAAGIFALALQANPNLTWRDLQHLIVKTAKFVSPRDKKWQTNGAGYKVNPKFGFGVLDANHLVLSASSNKWKTSDPQKICEPSEILENLIVRPRSSITSFVNTTGCAHLENCVTKLEHVVVIITLLKGKDRGELEIVLTSPSGTKSPLLQKRPHDRSGKGFRNWSFLTVFHWNEQPEGVWNLTVIDHSTSNSTLVSWKLRLHGTCKTNELSTSDRSLHTHDKIFNILISIFSILFIIK